MIKPSPLFVVGRWTILDEDREAQRKELPFWTLVEGDEIIAEGPIGRKSLGTDSYIYPCGPECDDIGMKDPDHVLKALDLHVRLVEALEKEHEAAQNHSSFVKPERFCEYCVLLTEARGEGK